MTNEQDSLKVRKELLALQDLTMPELIEKWKVLFHKAPPQYGIVFMRRRLAYRIQELTYGGLRNEVREKIESIDKKITRSNSRFRLGTIIERVWHDKTYQVRVCQEGFEWEGMIYNSLSSVAKAITGVQRSGFKFFGIKDEK